MKKNAVSSQSLNPIIQERWSPRSFDSNYEISSEDITAILEAGQWSPSPNNYQPWRFIVGKRNEKNFKIISETLNGFNKEWAPNASLYIIINGVMVDLNGNPITQSLYDCGIASAYMTMEANYRGYAVHQVGGFNRIEISNRFGLNKDIEPVSILVVGKQDAPEMLSNEKLIDRERAPRSRKPLNDLIISSD